MNPRLLAHETEPDSVPHYEIYTKVRRQRISRRPRSDASGSPQAPASSTRIRKRALETGDSAQEDLVSAKKPKLDFNSRECIICCDVLEAHEFPRAFDGSAHQHQSTVCCGCFEKHLKAEIAITDWDCIRCPQCSQTLQEPDLRTLSSKETYSR